MKCRFCKEQIEYLDKYVMYGRGVKAHWNCKLDSLGNQAAQEEWLYTLRSDQLRSIPWGIVQREKWMPHFLHLLLDARDRQPSSMTASENMTRRQLVDGIRRKLTERKAAQS